MDIFSSVYITVFAIGALIPALFAAYLVVFFLFIRERSAGGSWLLFSFAGQVLFYGGYVPAFALLEPAAAFHRWFTLGGVFPGIIGVVLFLVHYPVPLSSRLSRIAPTVLFAPFVLILALFIFRSLAAGKQLDFQVHGWDLRLEAFSSFIGLAVILPYMVLILVASLVRFAKNSRAHRLAGGIGLCFFAGTFAATVTNVLSRDGALDRGVHQIVMSLSSLTAFFGAFILYLNTTRERTTFMSKIVGISVVTFLLIFEFITYFTLADQERTYDAARDADVELFVGGAPTSSPLRFVNCFHFGRDRTAANVASVVRLQENGLGLPGLNSSQPEARNALVRARVVRAEGESPAARAGERSNAARALSRMASAFVGVTELVAAPASGPDAVPTNRPPDIAGDLLALLNEFDHPHFAGYRALILTCAGLPATARGPDQSLRATRGWPAVLDCLDDNRRPILVFANKLRRLEDHGYRADVTKALKGAKGNLVPFADAIRRWLSESTAEGADLKAEVLPFVAPMQPAGTRLYRMHTAADLNADPFTAFLHVDLERNQVYEAGFSYREYRAFIHPTALKLTIILLVGLAVILVGYRIFFAGALLAPLQQLLDGVKRVNAGNLDARVPVKVADEIGFLSESFNAMVGTIRDARDNLERKVSDRTEELQGAYDKLKEVDALKTNFFANVSHELRTPLTLMLTPLESMIGGDLGSVPAQQREFLLSVHRNGQKLLKLISNLLDFSKLEAGRLSLSYREYNFLEYVKSLTAAFDSSARSAGLEITVSSERDRIMAFFDPEKMEKVVLNLLSNSFKFTDRGGVYLEIGESDGIVEMRVRDTGIGIPDDKLDLVFERFQQVDGSATRKYEGTGIGLALARELAIAHQGTLQAEACATGASFLLRFPRVPEEMVGGKAGEDAGDGTGASDGDSMEGPRRQSSTRGAVLAELQERQSVVVGNDEESIEIITEERPAVRSDATVLIVEDTHDMRKLLYFLLAPHYQVLTARNGREGLEKAAAHRPNLILSDIMMPEMNGYELTAALRADPKTRTTPIVLLSAKADVGMRVRGLDQGADDYVVKPFNSAELLSRIRGQLRMQSMQREIASMRDRLQEVNDKLAGQVQLQVSELLLSEKFRNYLPPQLVESILRREGDGLVRSERRKLTIFFSDIVDFTRITDELEPEDLARLLNSYLSEMTVIARRHDAVVDKFIGDALLCHFGALRTRGESEDAEAAVTMAIDMQIRMRELSAEWIDQGFSEPLQIRCGLSTGFAAVGNFGSSERLDFTVIGSQVNLASRIQSHADPGGILVSHSTWALVNRSFRTESAGDIEPKGFRRSFPVYRVLL